MPQRIEDATLLKTELYDYQGGNKVIYVGKAHSGSSESVAVWQIYKLEYTGNLWTAKKWAKGSTEFKFSWNKRTAYKYS